MARVEQSVQIRPGLRTVFNGRRFVKPKRKKAKFKVGEIVVLRQSGVPYKISKVESYIIGGVAGYCNKHKCFTYKLPEHQALEIWDEKDLRPQTKRERGQ